MIIHEIIEDWLKQHGYDGLYASNCGCNLADLIPCCDYEGCLKCDPGYERPTDPSTGYDFIIVPVKEAT